MTVGIGASFVTFIADGRALRSCGICNSSHQSNFKGDDIMSPLKKGRSQATISSNIAECIRSYKKSGKVGNITPRNLAHASKVCQAAAYTSARRSRGKSVVSEALHNGRK